MENIIHNPAHIETFFNDYMVLTDPMFIGRIGGSDFELVCDYFNNKNIINDPQWVRYGINRVRDLNGYFDFDNRIENFEKYLNVLIESYQSSDCLSYGGKMEKHIRHYINGKSDLDPRFSFFVKHLTNQKTLFNFNDFIQTVRPFLKTFKNWGEGKTILIISPLSKSIEYQYQRKEKLFLDYEFPNFNLKTYNTNITYNNDRDTKINLKIKTNDWHEECDRIANEISKIDFDIAFLSCGSYAMFLGKYIKENLKKQSIYIGGPINCFFNIYGNRFNEMLKHINTNPNYCLDPFENKDIETIEGGRTYKTESLDAYFGKRI